MRFAVKALAGTLGGSPFALTTAGATAPPRRS